MDRNVETLAKRVKLMRTRRGLSQAALAQATGLKQPDISKIELGLIEKTTGIARLAEALAVSAKWLEFGVGEPETDREAIDGSPRLEVTDEQEIQLLQAFRALLPDDQGRIAAEIMAKAEEMRRHAAFLLDRALVQPPYFQSIARVTRAAADEPAPGPDKPRSPPSR